MTIQETFQQFIKLPARVAVYVPGTSGPAAKDPKLAERMTNDVAAALSELFGGATIQPASGAWMSDSFGLIREDVNIVYAYAIPEALNNRAAEVLEIVQRVKTEMQQEAVSVEIGGALYLV